MILLAILLAACAPAQPVIQTAIAQTQAVWTPIPTQTAYPTYTLQPTIFITKIVTNTFTPTPEITATPTLPAPFITADGGWGHITRNPTIAAMYMLIHNTGKGADRLIGASSGTCSRVGLQQMGNPNGSDMPFIVGIPAESIIELKWAAWRLLCYDVSGIGVGSKVPLTLNFEKFGAVKITIEIRETLQ